jgi:hypothetical protein
MIYNCDCGAVGEMKIGRGNQSYVIVAAYQTETKERHSSAQSIKYFSLGGGRC